MIRQVPLVNNNLGRKTSVITHTSAQAGQCCTGAQVIIRFSPPQTCACVQCPEKEARSKPYRCRHGTCRKSCKSREIFYIF